MLANMDISDYNIAFTQCLTDLGDQIQGEQVKIDKYRLGLQPDLRKMVRTSPQGTRWETLQALIEYSSLQWPIVAAGIAKRTKNPLLRRWEASARLVEVEMASALSPSWGQLVGSLKSRGLITSRTGSAISVERQVILLRIALIGILLSHLMRTRSRRRARKHYGFLDSLRSTGRLP
jgi:hypothetical protein